MPASRGFTLTEAAITVGILAMMAMVAVPAVNNTSRAELRSASGRIASAMRAAYDLAALSGKTYRLVFVLGGEEGGAPRVRVEATEELLSFDGAQNPISRASKGLGMGQWQAFALSADDEDAPALEELAEKAMGALLGVDRADADRANPVGAKFEEAAPPILLDPDVKLMDVWVEGMDKAQSEGEVFIYFFPHGYTQESIVHLQADTVIYSVKLAPLTGRPEVVAEYVEVPR